VLTAIRSIADNQVAQAQSVEQRRFETWVLEAVLIAECLGAQFFREEKIDHFGVNPFCRMG
jgi:hypothetical protein